MVSLLNKINLASLRKLLQAEEGMLTVVQLVTVTFFAVLVLLMLSVVNVLHDKIETQNAADASARAAATWLARGMNALSATNHLIGETVAMVVVYEAIAGPNPGGKQEHSDEEARSLDQAESELFTAYDLLQKHIASPPSDLEADLAQVVQSAAAVAYEQVKQPITELATVLKAKLRLKDLLIEVYQQKREAIEKIYRPKSDAELQSGLAAIPYLNAREADIKHDYDFLDAFSRHAGTRKFVLVRRTLLLTTLPALRDYTHLLVMEIPGIAQAAAAKIGSDNNTTTELYPKQPQLPVQIDPLAASIEEPHATIGLPNELEKVPQSWYGECKQTAMYEKPANVPYVDAIDKNQVVKITQLGRATFPWVNFHRSPVHDYLRDNCKVVEADEIYLDETAAATKRLCIFLQMAADGHFDPLEQADGRDTTVPEHATPIKEKVYQGLGLYVMLRATLPDKGYENWTDDHHELCGVATVVCVARRPRPRMLGKLSCLFPQVVSHESNMQAREHGATARAIVYNANPQEPHQKRIDLRIKRIIPSRQPKTGWDTLQWTTNEAGKMPLEFVGKEGQQGKSMLPEFPHSVLAWQAKLVPVSPGEREKSTVARQADAVFDDFSTPSPLEVNFLEKFAELATH